MKRVVVRIGDISMGGDNPIVVQSMCNTFTQDVEASYNQCVKLIRSGAHLIRLTTQGMKEVDALKEIIKRLRENGMQTPISADVHFTADVAIAVAQVADKVRVNPGNFARDFEVGKLKFAQFIEICKKRGVAIRVGINHGSLGDRILEKYGDTPLGMKEAAMEWIKLAEENDFDQIVVSLKSSNTLIMTEAYRLIHNEFIDRAIYYPLHLGVTEAGNGESGRIKSAVGLATLLSEGIGNTIRVSLTEDPVNEIPVAKFIVDHFSGYKKREIYRSGYPQVVYEERSWSDFILRASCDLGPPLLDKKIDNVDIKALIDGVAVEKKRVDNFKSELLQATRRVFTKPEYIACPGCGRTLFDLEKIFEEVKRRTAHLKGYNIAVMGCIVNGPGEMADADYGYVGEGKGRVSIYRAKEPVYRAVPQEEAIDKLIELIEEDARNKVFRPRSG